MSFHVPDSVEITAQSSLPAPLLGSFVLQLLYIEEGDPEPHLKVPSTVISFRPIHTPLKPEAFPISLTALFS